MYEGRLFVDVELASLIYFYYLALYVVSYLSVCFAVFLGEEGGRDATKRVLFFYLVRRS